MNEIIKSRETLYERQQLFKIETLCDSEKGSSGFSLIR